MAKTLKNNAKVVFISVIVMVCMWTIFSNAGDLDPPLQPGPTMKTLDEIYDAVVSSTEVSQREPCMICKSTGAYDSIDLLTVPEGKRFVLLKWYNQDVRYDLYVNDTTTFIPYIYFGWPADHTIDFPDGCVVVNAGEKLP